MRFKNRYLLLQIVWKDGKRDESLNEGLLVQHVRETIQLNFGDFQAGSSAASVQVKYLSILTGLCVLRCGQHDLQQVLGAVSLISEIKHHRILLRTLHIAGTMQACRDTAWKHHVATVTQARLLPQHHVAVAAAEERLLALEL